MNREAIKKSSNIASVGYDEEKKELEVEFKVTGGVYVYYDVPKRTHTNLMNAQSKGIFFAKYIKHNYRYERV